MFIYINWINLAWSRQVKPTNCIHFAFDDIHHENIWTVHLYCCVFEFISFNQQLVMKGCVKKKIGNFFSDF